MMKNDGQLKGVENDKNAEQKQEGEQKEKFTFFKIGDLFVYCLIFVCCVTLFIFAFWGGQKGLSGVQVLYTKGQTESVLTYSFVDDKLEISSAWQQYVELTNQEDKLCIKISQKEGDGYNTLVIEREGKVYMQYANCSFHKDCTKMNAIEKGDGAIICVPHHLTVLPLESKPKDDLTTLD